MREKPILYYSGTSESGNIFWILGQVRRILQKQRRIQAYNDLWERVQRASNYREALEIIGEEVMLIDTDK